MSKNTVVVMAMLSATFLGGGIWLMMPERLIWFVAAGLAIYLAMQFVQKTVWGFIALTLSTVVGISIVWFFKTNLPELGLILVLMSLPLLSITEVEVKKVNSERKSNWWETGLLWITSFGTIHFLLMGTKDGSSYAALVILFMQARQLAFARIQSEDKRRIVVILAVSMSISIIMLFACLTELISTKTDELVLIITTAILILTTGAELLTTNHKKEEITST